MESHLGSDQAGRSSKSRSSRSHCQCQNANYYISYYSILPDLKENSPLSQGNSWNSPASLWESGFSAKTVHWGEPDCRQINTLLISHGKSLTFYLAVSSYSSQPHSLARAPFPAERGCSMSQELETGVPHLAATWHTLHHIPTAPPAFGAPQPRRPMLLIWVLPHLLRHSSQPLSLKFPPQAWIQGGAPPCSFFQGFCESAPNPGPICLGRPYLNQKPWQRSLWDCWETQTSPPR